MNYTDDSIAALAFEENGSPEEQWSEGGLRATVRLRTLWTNRYTVMNDLLANYRAYPRVLGGAGGDEPVSFAAQGQIAPVARSNAEAAGEQALLYEHALLTVQYEPSSFADPGGGNPLDLYSESIEPNAEFFSVDSGGMFWDAANFDPAQNVDIGRQIVSLDYVQTRYRMVSLPVEILSLVGKVNAAEVVATVLGLTFPAETLLFMPSTSDRTVSSNGDSLWTLHTRYSYRPDGWNKVFRKETGTFETLFKGPLSPYEPYPLGDFSSVHI